jgi:hypothetical protein
MTNAQVISCRSISKTEKEIILIAAITEEQEKQLDKGFLKYEDDDCIFKIDSSCKPIYGPIDFHTGSDDYCVLETMNWLDHLTGVGVIIPSDYNYEEHCCYSPLKKARFYDTTNPAKVAQYKHACLGKPERVCIFRVKRKKYGK